MTGETTGSNLPTETDTLLPKRPPPPSLRQIWTSSTAADKTLMLLGAIGAIVGGCANGLTCILYGRVLDTMARATLEGVDKLLFDYGQLAVAELLGVWLQFCAWSRVASHRQKTKADDDQGEDTTEDCYLEALGEAVYSLALGVTAIAIALFFGWDSLLAIIVVTGLTALLPWLMFKWISRNSQAKSSQTGGELTKDEEDRKLLEQEVDELWRHARALKLMDATVAAKDCMQRLLTTKRKSFKCMVAMGMLAFFLPVAVAFVYTTWKVSHSTSTSVATNLAVVFLASWGSFASLQRAWAMFSKGDVSLKSLQIKTKAGDTLSEEDKTRALNWLRSITRGSARRTAVIWLTLASKTVLYIVAALMVGLSFAWLLQMPYAAPPSLGDVYKYTAGLMLVGFGLGLAFEASISAQRPVCSKARETVFLRTFTARLELQDETITGKSLVEDSSHIAMYTWSLVEPRHVGWVATFVLAILVGLFIDPWFTLATLLVTPASFLPYALHMKRDKALYRSFLDTAWPIAVVESLFRAVIHSIPRAATIALVYIQIQWIADRRSSLFSVLTIECLSFVCFSISHTSRFSMGAFIHDEALAAAARLQCFIERADHLTPLLLSDPNEEASPMRLEGDLRIESTTEGIAFPCVQDGQLVVLGSEDTAGLLSVSLGLLRVDQSASTSATIGGVDMASLPLSVIRSRIMTIDADPVRLPGTLRDNVRVSYSSASPQDVEEAAQLAGLQVANLQNELTLDEWLTGENAGELKRRVLTARVLVRKPDLVIVEDFNSSSESSIELMEAVATIRQEMPQCKVLVLANDTAERKWAS